MAEKILARKKVLVLCTGNSCRSQMAEGFFRALGGALFDVSSAGVAPTVINPLTVEVMRQAGIDISSQYSKSVKDLADERFDFVITVCHHAKETCPFFPGDYDQLHWDLKDPALAKGSKREKFQVFCQIRDKIKAQIEEFLNIHSQGNFL